jgi:hypothetical protein
VPFRKVLGWNGLAAVLGVAEVDDEGIPPDLGVRADAVFASAKLADGGPGPRSKVSGVECVETGHVGA